MTQPLKNIYTKKPKIPCAKLALAMSMYEEENPHGYGEQYLEEQSKAFNDLLSFCQKGEACDSVAQDVQDILDGGRQHDR